MDELTYLKKSIQDDAIMYHKFLETIVMKLTSLSTHIKTLSNQSHSNQLVQMSYALDSLIMSTRTQMKNLRSTIPSET
jgi:hypothetical protein